MIDVAAVRADTPACASLIHFNNAGAALMPEPVYQAVADHLSLEYQIGGYEAENRAAPKLMSMYQGLARMLGGNPDDFAYVENATRGWDMAFYSLPLKEGDHILTHGSEYASNYLAFIHQAKRKGLIIDVVPSDGQGQIDVRALERMIVPRSRVVAITHVPTQGGLVNPAAEVGSVARKHGLFYLLDACQSVGQLQVNIGEIGCHLLSGTGRKFLRGPRGTGFLYVSPQIIDGLDPPFIDLHAAKWVARDRYELAKGAKRFENWESYVAGRVGLTEALAYANRLGISAIEQRVSMLARLLREELSKIPGITVQDRGERRCGIVTFDKENEAAEAIVKRLVEARINVTSSTVFSARLDFEERRLGSIVRASVHYYNTEDEVDRFCRFLRNR